MNSPSQAVAGLYAASKHFGERCALDRLDLEVRHSEVLALIGVNGAGKSTAIGLMLGLQTADAGRAELFGEPPQLRSARSRVGVMLQAAALPAHLRVVELLDLVRSYYPAPRSTAECAELAGIGELLPRRYAKLSGGQQRRVQFALALCGRPELMFLDEPTTGLDVEARETLWAAMRRQVAAGCSVLLTTHYLEEAEALADRVVVIAAGRVVAAGSVDEIRGRVAAPRLRARSRLDVAELQSWSGVLAAERSGEWIEVRAEPAEDVLRRWLDADRRLDGLEVRRAGLAEAYLELTRDRSGAAAGAQS